ncbi:hypothetical protein D7294_14255 [Streptomyces hoynatensis]|uniref:Secreted protein n=1 Tax=Streptomyces hoynatensis TaxID=1141874 RepID=A0A3A9Z3H9_9ACTN|nr:hypothetical protein D7294_14255 [Streptomyces hoynatensis]
MRRAVGVAAALAGIVLGATATARAEEPGAAAPGFDLASCPSVAALPSGADPADWRCEAMAAEGSLSIGRLQIPVDRPMTITFAEGTVDGSYRQVFGAMTASPLPLPGTPWRITPGYGGDADFQSNDERRGELDMTLGLSGPGLPRGCTIGTQAEPIHLVLKDTEPTSVISQDPLIVHFAAEDRDFAAPRTSQCGPLGRVLDRILGLPAGAGSNGLALSAQVALRPYAEAS